jgi:hypothetical protein
MGGTRKITAIIGPLMFTVLVTVGVASHTAYKTGRYIRRYRKKNIMEFPLGWQWAYGIGSSGRKGMFTDLVTGSELLEIGVNWAVWMEKVGEIASFVEERLLGALCNAKQLLVHLQRDRGPSPSFGAKLKPRRSGASGY